MTYYLAADDRTLAILRSDGMLSTIALKSHPLSKGFTKAQAAVELMQLLGVRVIQGKADRFANLGQMLKSNADLSRLFFNEPPQAVPIVHSLFLSLDSTNVENWLRKVFGEYRDCLPPIVSSLQQESENWTGLRWITNKHVPERPLEQVDLAQQTHIGIADWTRDRQMRLREQQFQGVPQ